MSLSVPYVLRAAVVENPSLVLCCEDGNRFDVATASRLSREEAETLWALGYRPADRLCTTDPLTQLAAARLGLVICAEGLTKPSQPPGEACNVHTAETRIWSETVLILIAATTVSHGDYLDAARCGNTPDAAQPLTNLIRPILIGMENNGAP